MREIVKPASFWANFTYEPLVKIKTGPINECLTNLQNPFRSAVDRVLVLVEAAG